MFQTFCRRFYAYAAACVKLFVARIAARRATGRVSLIRQAFWSNALLSGLVGWMACTAYLQGVHHDSARPARSRPCGCGAGAVNSSLAPSVKVEQEPTLDEKYGPVVPVREASSQGSEGE